MMKVTKVTSRTSIQHKKIYILKTYKLKKQKQKHLIWNKNYKKKYMPNFCTLAVYLSIRQYSPGNCLSKKILYMKYEW